MIAHPSPGMNPSGLRSLFRRYAESSHCIESRSIQLSRATTIARRLWPDSRCLCAASTASAKPPLPAVIDRDAPPPIPSRVRNSPAMRVSYPANDASRAGSGRTQNTAASATSRRLQPTSEKNRGAARGRVAEASPGSAYLHQVRGRARKPLARPRSKRGSGAAAGVERMIGEPLDAGADGGEVLLDRGTHRRDRGSGP